MGGTLRVGGGGGGVRIGGKCGKIMPLQTPVAFYPGI